MGEGVCPKKKKKTKKILENPACYHNFPMSIAYFRGELRCTTYSSADLRHQPPGALPPVRWSCQRLETSTGGARSEWWLWVSVETHENPGKTWAAVCPVAACFANNKKMLQKGTCTLHTVSVSSYTAKDRYPWDLLWTSIPLSKTRAGTLVLNVPPIQIVHGYWPSPHPICK